MQHVDSKFVEWIPKSGSQVNVCGDLSLFTTIKEDQTSQPDFANGTIEHTSVCESVILRVVNQATGELEDRLLDDVVHTPNAKVNVISLGYLPTKGNYKLTCSNDEQTAWFTKPSTSLKVTMRGSIYRLRAERVTGVMVMAALKQDVYSKKAMELLHQRFGHMKMESVKVLAKKIGVGVKINTKDLASYTRVVCAAAVAKRTSYARIPMRKSEPLKTLMMDICSVNEQNVDGATTFLFNIDESTSYKWPFLLKKQSETTFHINALLNKLRTRFPERTAI
ncbi:hypothetical protein PI124_g20074 [Phytophthora idaei]|nr:hypothetical protein PI125_g18515 [Phytophthora idaei]KAG3132371.1 hypothetical protein PI126_g19672 [Phytophthora idaei]KAG3234879.1 hypothetical protein PI124_g20074 [Phytophthora idaei]